MMHRESLDERTANRRYSGLHMVGRNYPSELGKFDLTHGMMCHEGDAR